ncbi:DUF397 domain-containing protein [Lipingzhangella sp. LS1_29]|uniref:DUF397 domain-containing protein n=1 Tax=Lipingzhangella rawalii TaxID=2055835 RepID=A0ABU2H1L6_9ACTN|nr:DUF397 domain-containing protein [Lipingzhangella rawalii]MDS1268715.1 DUF397 domain-containing protein [Lipingzhangella rawalii]
MTAGDFTWTISSYSSNRNGECVEVGWHKSSYSSNGGPECVEVRRMHVAAAPVALRDSKNRGAGHLTLPTHEWTAFLHAVRTSEYGA